MADVEQSVTVTVGNEDKLEKGITFSSSEVLTLAGDLLRGLFSNTDAESLYRSNRDKITLYEMATAINTISDEDSSMDFASIPEGVKRSLLFIQQLLLASAAGSEVAVNAFMKDFLLAVFKTNFNERGMTSHQALNIASLLTFFSVDIYEIYEGVINNQPLADERHLVRGSGEVLSVSFQSLLKVIEYMLLIADKDGLDKLLPTIKSILLLNIELTSPGAKKHTRKSRYSFVTAVAYKMAEIKAEYPLLAAKLYKFIAAGDTDIKELCEKSGQESGITGNGALIVSSHLDLAKDDIASTIKIIRYADVGNIKQFENHARIIINQFPESIKIKQAVLERILSRQNGNVGEFSKKKYELLIDCWAVNGQPVPITQAMALNIFRYIGLWNSAVGIDPFHKNDLSVMRVSKVQFLIKVLLAQFDEEKLKEFFDEVTGKGTKDYDIYSYIQVLKQIRSTVADAILKDDKMRERYEPAEETYARIGDERLTLDMIPEKTSSDHILLGSNGFFGQCYYHVLEDGVLAEKVEPIVDLPKRGVLHAFSYKKPDVTKNSQTGKGLLNPIEAWEDKKRESYHPLAVITEKHYRGPNHWHRSDEGLFCAVRGDDGWETRYFPKSNIPDTTWNEAKAIISQV